MKIIFNKAFVQIALVRISGAYFPTQYKYYIIALLQSYNNISNTVKYKERSLTIYGCTDGKYRCVTTPFLGNIKMSSMETVSTNDKMGKKYYQSTEHGN